MNNKKSRKRSHVRIVNRKRFFTMILLLVAILSTSLISLTFGDSEQGKKYIQVTVSEGDTLWSISSKFNDTFFENTKDVRKIIYIVAKENNIENNIIHPGDVLLIPSEI